MSRNRNEETSPLRAKADRNLKPQVIECRSSSTRRILSSLLEISLLNSSLTTKCFLLDRWYTRLAAREWMSRSSSSKGRSSYCWKGQEIGKCTPTRTEADRLGANA